MYTPQKRFATLTFYYLYSKFTLFVTFLNVKQNIWNNEEILYGHDVVKILALQNLQLIENYSNYVQEYNSQVRIVDQNTHKTSYILRDLVNWGNNLLFH